MEEKKSILHGDKYIWGIFILLCIISIVEIFSATSTLTYKSQDTLAPTIRHIQILLVGAAIVVGVHNVHYRYFKLIPIVLIPVSLLLLLYVSYFGESVNNAQRSAFGIQPSEIAKIAVVTGVAYILAIKQTAKGVLPKTFRTILYIAVPPTLLIFPENFSTAALIAAVVFCMMLIGRVELSKLFGSVAICISFMAILLYAVPALDSSLGGGNSNPTQSEVAEGGLSASIHKRLQRLVTWRTRIEEFSKEKGHDYLQKTNDDNYQEHHAKMAIANGGMLGVFPGNSRERDFLPQAYSDFIYAIIIEETGFVGGIVVLLLYLFLLIRTAIIARKCTRAFPAFLLMGLSMLIVFQALINMGVSAGAFPVTGQPLPLISRGGNSALACCICFGMMLSISRFSTIEEAKKENINPEEGLSEELSAPNPNQI